MANVTAAAVCSECGELLGAKGACIACLLRAGFEETEEAPPAKSAWTFGDYEIERREDGSPCELGRGAMGITYRALDKVLHRAVALKVIEPPASAADDETVRERFLREARAAAALRHPNVAGVFQFGASPESNRCYCALELVEGETLEARIRREGPLKTDVALEIAIQVTRALMAAAERGLVHRDLKPGNIMLARSDDPARVEVKVIDFGLAKATAGAGEMELTHGAFVGTPAFASPEQFAGEAVDARSDIYALGVTLWFALTGRLPSAGTTIEEIRQRQAHHKLPLEQLASKRVPQRVSELLQSCLAIDPAERPASARELMQALEDCRAQLVSKKRGRALALSSAVCVIVIALAAAFLFGREKAVPGAGEVVPDRAIEKGIAVLPFENLSTDTADTFFVDGMQDDILTSVGKIKDLKVIARASVMEYRGARLAGKVREIGRALGVSHVLEGSVRRAGDRVVVSVALIDTRDERQVWSERYERSLTDALSLQGELALEIARALRTTVSPPENTNVVGRPTADPDAYLLYLRARDLELEQLRDRPRAARLYEEAVARDPFFALAHARLSISASELSRAGDANATWAAKADHHAREAVRLQPNLGEAGLALATYHVMVERDYDRALHEISRTIELLPNSAEVWLTAAFIHKLKGRYGDRINDLRRAEALDPRNTRVLATLARTLRWVRDWAGAVQTLDRVAAVESEAPTTIRLHWIRANDEFRRSGNIDVLKRALDVEAAATPPLAPEWLARSRFDVAMLERDYARAAAALAEFAADAPGSDYQHLWPHTKQFHESLLRVARGDDPAATRDALVATATELEQIIAQDTPLQVRAGSLHADLAIIYALLGRKELAISTVQRAIDLENTPSGAVEKNARASALALVHTLTGEPDKALDLIEHLLTVPCELQSGEIYNMTLTDLKWRWVWDPLRSHPRFEKLLSGPEPPTVY